VWHQLRLEMRGGNTMTVFCDQRAVFRNHDVGALSAGAGGLAGPLGLAVGPAVLQWKGWSVTGDVSLTMSPTVSRWGWRWGPRCCSGKGGAWKVSLPHHVSHCVSLPHRRLPCVSAVFPGAEGDHGMRHHQAPYAGDESRYVELIDQDILDRDLGVRALHRISPACTAEARGRLQEEWRFSAKDSLLVLGKGYSTNGALVTRATWSRSPTHQHPGSRRNRRQSQQPKRTCRKAARGGRCPASA
jgi:hypothetical protein